MKTLPALSFLMIGACHAHAQPDVKIWTRLAGSINYDEGYAVAADPSGNCIIAGGTQGSLFTSTHGRYDLFVGKYDTDGNLQWGRQRGTGEREFAYGVATDSSGNIYATGYTGAALDGQSHVGNWDVYLTKFSPAGDWLWTRQIGTGQDDEGYAVTTDASDNVYITGYVRGNIHGQTRVGSADVFLSKYNGAGTRLWTRLFGSLEIDQGWAVRCDTSGNVFVTGYCQGSIEGNPYHANGDLFLAKYDTHGNRLWLRQWGTINAEHGYSLATAADGSVYLSGYTTGTLYGPKMGGRDVFLARFDAAGNELWGRQFGTVEHDQGWGITMGIDGNTYLSGQVAGPIDENTHFGDLDIFLARYSPEGTRMWTTQVGSAAGDWARGVATTSEGVVFLAGTTVGHLDGITNKGVSDVFAMKFVPAADLSLGEPTDTLASPATVCSGNATRLSATPGLGGDTVEWFTGSCGGTQVPGGASPMVSPTVTTTYHARTASSVTGLVSSTCAAVTVTAIPSVSPDLDADCDVDESDHILFMACLSGSGIPPVEGCARSDFDGDDSVDLSDYGLLQRCRSGDHNLVDPSCAD